jgi:hypothetical protein
MFHPLNDFTKLSDDDLIDKINGLYEKISHAESHGFTQMANDIRLTIASMEAEQVRRMGELQKEHDERDRKSNKNYKDPLAPITFGEIEGIDDQDE